MSELYQLLPAGAIPFGVLAVGEQFNRLGADGTPGNGTYSKINADIAADSAGDLVPISPYELIRPDNQPVLSDNTAIVEDIRRQPAPVCTCSNCAGLLDPGECGCLCRVCATAGAPARPRPIRRFTLHLCPCCSSAVASMDRWCSTCGQPLYTAPGAVPF